MNNRQLRFQIVLYVFAVLSGIVVGPVLLRSVSGFVHPLAAAQTVQEADSSFAPNIDVACTIRDVAAFDSRVHVRCYEGFGEEQEIVFFAAPTSDTQRADRFLSIFLTAHAMDKRLEIRFDPNSSGADFGCSLSDCRPFTGARILD